MEKLKEGLLTRAHKQLHRTKPEAEAASTRKVFTSNSSFRGRQCKQDKLSPCLSHYGFSNGTSMR